MPFLAGALLALALAGPGAASAATPEAGPLTPELATLAEAAVAAESASAQAEAIGLPAEGPGSLVREGERVVVEAHFEAGALARVEALKSTGAKVLLASRRYQTVALAVEPEDLEALAGIPGLKTVEPSLAPVFYGAGETASTAATTSNGLCEGGSVISQGLEQLNVTAAREDFGARGAGETIGVISDSFDSATTSLGGGAIASTARDDEISNDLPGPNSTCEGQQVPVRVLAEAPAGEATDEGRAMLQVVHDLAPHAELAFATAYSTELEFARNIERLAEPVAAGGAAANVIVDDVSYFAEPFFQEGPVANAIRKVKGEGVTYLTAAGNDNLIENGTHNEFASWERSEFDDTACPSVLGSRVREASPDCMNFSPTGNDATYGITVEKEATLTVDLQWAEPWYGVESDLNAYLLNSSGQVITSVAPPKRNVGSGSGVVREPVEIVQWTNPAGSKAEVQLVIDRCVDNCNSAANVSAEPRVKVALMEDGSGVSKTQYPESDEAAGIVVGPTIYGHAGSTAAITLGAVNYEKSKTAPTEPESYSSRGPVTHYFFPVSGITPAAPLVAPEVIQKPNLTATDCASTTFFATHSSGAWHFCGTSEAGPHAAAVAALMRQTDLVASPIEIRDAMESSATPFTLVSSPVAVGAGMLNADAALVALGGAQVTDPPSATTEALENTENKETGVGEAGSGEENPVTPQPTPPAPTPPTVTITAGPALLGNNNRPTFEFSASKPATFDCQIDGGTPQPCSSPYLVPSALADGTHGFAATATDSEGRTGSSAVYSFTVDTKAPRPRVVGHPNKVVKTAKSSYVARFRVAAEGSGITYYCQFDREPLRICGQRFSHRFAPGHHVLKVRAKDELGNLTVSPTVFHFTVKALGPARSAP
ncbi:MAG TPA: S8 family serine peptidase [Solirubrobacterales bacterium]|nr:S8 family serine peptidase [Solirubrobacterales bacterium]